MGVYVPASRIDRENAKVNVIKFLPGEVHELRSASAMIRSNGISSNVNLMESKAEKNREYSRGSLVAYCHLLIPLRRFIRSVR